MYDLNQAKNKFKETISKEKLKKQKLRLDEKMKRVR